METNGGRIQGRDKWERDRREGARAPAGARDREIVHRRSPQGEPHSPRLNAAVAMANNALAAETSGRITDAFAYWDRVFNAKFPAYY
jgi:hypothetical protein